VCQQERQSLTSILVHIDETLTLTLTLTMKLNFKHKYEVYVAL
jgi:hypothetical protein